MFLCNNKIICIITPSYVPDPHDSLKANLPGDVTVQTRHKGSVCGRVSRHMEVREVVDGAAREFTDPRQCGKINVLGVEGKQVHCNLEARRVLC